VLKTPGINLAQTHRGTQENSIYRVCGGYGAVLPGNRFVCVFSASLRCRGFLVYFLGALPRRRAGKSIWLTLSIEKAIGSKS
jgi:hypothetical protein